MYYAFLFFIQLLLVAIQLFNIDPILIDRLHLSQQKHRWQPLNARLNAQGQQKMALSPNRVGEGEADKLPNVTFQQENG